jgi:4-amino-4-deoxy-L-arabinose transferase-like glycosyltransferase
MIPIVAALLLLVAVCRAVRPDDTPMARRVMKWALVSFAVHFLLGYVILQSASFAHSLASDATTYDLGARLIVAHWHHLGPLPHMSKGKEGFYYSLAVLYWAVGPYPLAGFALNAFFAAATVPLMFDVTRRLFDSDAAWWAVVIVSLQPGFLVWPAQLLREAGALFFLAVALDCAVRLATRANLSAALLLAADVGLFLTYRSDVALIVAVGLVIGLALGRRQVVGGVLVAGTVVAMGLVLVLALGVGRSGYQLATSANLAQVSNARHDLARTATSGFDVSVSVSTPRRALSYLPKGLPYFLWGPFPWQARNVPALFSVVDALTVTALTPSMWRGFKEARERVGRMQLLLLLPAAALTLGLTLLIGNFGTIVRERLQVLVFLIPLAGLGIARQRAQRSAATVTAGAAESAPARATA